MKFFNWFNIFIFLIMISPMAMSAQQAVVITDGAMVYQKADFDASVIGYLRAGQTVEISNKTFGAFYRVRFQQGVLGYVSDVDVQGKGEGPKNFLKTPKDHKINKSFISKKYFGVTLGSLNFSEVYTVQGANTQVSQSLMFFGLKYSGPMRFLTGPFVFDSELFYYSGVPKYYNTSTSSGNSGRIVLLDAEVFYSLFESRKRNFWVYVGAGPALSYTSFVVTVSGSQNGLSQVQFGGVITGGAALKISKFALKLEPKYFAFKSGYFGMTGALQFEF